MNRRRLAMAGATALALALPLFSSPAASAAPVSVTSTQVSAAAIDALCAVPSDVSSRVTPKERSHPDTPPVNASDLAAMAPKRPALAAMRADRVLPNRVTIPVHVTLVRGAHRGDTNRGPAAVRQWIALLNNAYAGKQSSASHQTRYTFRLSTLRRVKNDKWYHAVGNSRYDQQMRRKLHRGNASALNLYVTSPGRGNSGILGFARFPWNYSAAPRLDGVTVNVKAMPGGSIRRYNLGDTLVHEVGHWLGLYHTFQGGCGDPDDPRRTGDQVTDTAPEAEPNFACAVRDSCPEDRDPANPDKAWLDPVRNFMDYSYDACMNMFTEKQSERMDTVFERYRYGR